MTSIPPEAETIAEIAADLRDDPVLVHQSMGNGHTLQAAEELRALADRVDFPVYVALVQPPADQLTVDRPNAELLRLLHRELDEPGLYIVQSTSSIMETSTYGIDLDEVQLSLASYRGQDLVKQEIDFPDSLLGPVGSAAVTLTVAGNDPADPQLSKEQAQQIAGSTALIAANVDEPSSWDLRDAHGEPLTPLVVAVAAGLTALVVGWRLLRARSATPAPPTAPSTAEADDLRRRLDRLVGDLDRRTARFHGDPAAKRAAEDRLSLARRLRDSEEVLDVIGGLVLATDGLARLARRPRTYVPCFFNPLHGPATGTVAAGSGTRADSVSTCARCGRAVESGEQPEALIDPGAGVRRRPYYEGRTVWAQTGFGDLVDDLPRAVALSRGTGR